jgi:hypothetical protein
MRTSTFSSPKLIIALTKREIKDGRMPSLFTGLVGFERKINGEN